MQWWVVYGCLAVAACLTAWRDGGSRAIGVALLISWALSNIVTFTMASAERPAAYTVCEALVMSMAFFGFVCGGSRALIGVVAVSITSVAFNLYFSFLTDPDRAQVHAWQVATNVCFAIECLIVVGSGLYARTRVYPHVGRAAASLHGRAAASGATS